MRRIRLDITGTKAAADLLRRAWRATERGKRVEPILAVDSLERVKALLSPKRVALLRFVGEHPGLSVRALASAIDRDYKNVHGDVTQLEAQGLLERDESQGLRLPFDEVLIRVPLRELSRS